MYIPSLLHSLSLSYVGCLAYYFLSFLQCCHVLVRHVWKVASVQEVCINFTNYYYYFFLWILILYMYAYIHICFLSRGFWIYVCILVCGRAFVFFSSPISRDLVSHIKKDTTVLPRIGALREVSLLALFFVLLIDYRSESNYIFQLGVFSFSSLVWNLLHTYILSFGWDYADEFGVLCYRQPGIWCTSLS